MARLFMTGMTSHQSSRKLNARSLRFSGGVVDILERNGHSVEWSKSQIVDSKSLFDDYDVVIVGVAPPLSVTANNAYGALSAINAMWGDERLVLIVDTPTPASVTANLRAIERDESRLFSSFYRARTNYKDIVSTPELRSSVLSAVSRLKDEQWPTTLYPVTPWTDARYVESKLPGGAAEKVTGICVDSHYLSSSMRLSNTVINRWAIDTDKTRWTESTLMTLKYPHVHMAPKRSFDDDAVSEMIASSFGAMISPNADGTLSWSSRWFQSMNVGTPLVSDWKITSTIGNAWSHLAAGIEEMTLIDRYELSVSQAAEYISAIPAREEVTTTIETTIGVSHGSSVQ